MDRFTEERNYARDHRVRALEDGDWFDSFDESDMTAVVPWWDDDGEEHMVTVPVVFDVCPTCEGKGKHVNPSIDASGLTAEDFADDPDFHEQYMSGAYDVRCYGCQGRRVVPVPELDRLDEKGRRAVAEHGFVDRKRGG